MNCLKTLEKLVFTISETNFKELAKLAYDLFDPDLPYTFHLMICKLIYSAFLSKGNNMEIYFDYLNEVQKQEEKITIFSIMEIFLKYILEIDSQESYYILEKMIQKQLIDMNIIKNKKTLYFEHYQRNEKNYNSSLPFSSHFISNIEELSKDDWNLHKQFIKEGHNPNAIAKIIRNDEVEKLQEISSQNNFDFNQRIEPSLYERCDFVNQRGVTLIDYAAFFGSIKCFKYLLMNGAKVDNTGKYAVAGGNIEIVHLCEQNHSSFKDTYETAIKFHRNDIFHYFYDDESSELRDLTVFGIACLNFNNFEIFSFLQEEGMKGDSELFKAAIKYGNSFFVKQFLQKIQMILI